MYLAICLQQGSGGINRKLGFRRDDKLTQGYSLCHSGSRPLTLRPFISVPHAVMTPSHKITFIATS